MGEQTTGTTTSAIVRPQFYRLGDITIVLPILCAHVDIMASQLAQLKAGRMSQHVGKVMWFNNAKGFGFISREGGPDVFVHHTAIKMERYHTLKEGEDVEFDIEIGSSGKKQAARVLRVEKVS